MKVCQMVHELTQDIIKKYEAHLLEDEKSSATLEKYLATLRKFHSWLDGRQVTRGLTAQYKEYLIGLGRAPATVNVKKGRAVIRMKGKIRTIFLPERVVPQAFKVR